jgi:hypothetical protein
LILYVNKSYSWGLAPGQKPDDGATCHSERAGRQARHDPKFDDDSSEQQTKFKNHLKNNSRALDLVAL